MSSKFSKRLALALELRKWKPIDLARRTGIPRATISAYLHNKWNAKQDKLYIIGKAMNINLAWLMGYGDDDQYNMNKDEINKTIGNRIKYYRKQKDITLKELARQLGIVESTAQRYETGNISNVSIVIFEKIAKALNVSSADLLGWTDEVIPTTNIISHDYPYLDNPISAGTPETFEHVSNLPTISIADCYVGKYAGDCDVVIMKVNGESMNKVIPNGSFIAVKRNIDYGCVSNGDIIVAYFLDGVDRGGYTIKRIYKDDKNDRVILRPDSTDPEFVDIIVDKEKGDALSIIGKVIAYNVIL